jgi:hypothetical protein
MSQDFIKPKETLTSIRLRWNLPMTQSSLSESLLSGSRSLQSRIRVIKLALLCLPGLTTSWRHASNRFYSSDVSLKDF